MDKIKEFLLQLGKLIFGKDVNTNLIIHYSAKNILDFILRLEDS